MTRIHRALVVSRVRPASRHTERAGNVVLWELLEGLAQESAWEIGYLRFARTGDRDGVSRDESEGLCAAHGIVYVGEIKVPEGTHRASGALARLMMADPRHFYPEIGMGRELEEACSGFGADLIITVWSEGATAAAASIELPKYAYYGNPDPKAAYYRALYDRRHGYLRRPWPYVKANLAALERAHWKVMRRFRWVGNVARNDAAYYARKGHPGAFYVRNVWIDRYRGSWVHDRRRSETGSTVRIIANVGRLDGTANRYGLEYLGHEVLPALRRHMGGVPYEVHLCGGGTLPSHLEDTFAEPSVRLRGYVDDIDAELLSSHVFLCVNNGTAYKVGHTRYLHAWSLGMCVVAHSDVRLSMPELVDRENCLLGGSADEMAARVAECATDVRLRRELGSAGYETFRKLFLGEKVARAIVENVAAGCGSEVERAGG